MASAAQFLTLQQFEQTYGDEKPYYEYWFGEAIQKSMPTSLHGSTQILLGMLIFARGWKVASEVEVEVVAICESNSGSGCGSEPNRIAVSDKTLRALH